MRILKEIIKLKEFKINNKNRTKKYFDKNQNKYLRKVKKTKSILTNIKIILKNLKKYTKTKILKIIKSIDLI